MLVCCFIFFGHFNVLAQSKTNPVKKFKDLSRPEKFWAIRHPFIAKKTYFITLRVLKTVGEVQNDSLNGILFSAEKLDAFKHAFWMASLSQKIFWLKAKQLGIAHEKGNKLMFYKEVSDFGDSVRPFLTHDKASMEMDLFNNQYGILIGRQYKNLNENELKIMIIKSVLNGELKVLKQDKNGNYLDENGLIIIDWKGKWESGRVLIRSDYDFH